MAIALTNTHRTCTLTVKIKNQGDQGYRQDIYGDSIIVERYFSLHGSPGFRVKNSNGKMVSNKRYELDEITDFFAMQLDNPVNVLTQDMARQFLNSSTEVEKYKFFIKGVQLEQLDNDYTLLSDSLDNADALMENVQDDMKVMVKNFDDANRKFELSQRQGTLRDKIGRLSRQMAWAQVEEQENVSQECPFLFIPPLTTAYRTLRSSKDRLNKLRQKLNGVKKLLPTPKLRLTKLVVPGKGVKVFSKNWRRAWTL